MNDMNRGGGGLDLEHRLTALFTDSEFDVPLRPGSTEATLARVRRLRRQRRAMQAGGSLLVAATACGVLVSGVGTGLFEARPQMQTPATSPAEDEPRISPTGVGELRLGMSLDEARATGLLAGDPQPDGSACATYAGRRGLSIVIGPSGVDRITTFSFTGTPEGAAVGDAYEELHQRYPDAVPARPAIDGTEVNVPAPGGKSSYVFTFETPDDGRDPGPSDRITTISVEKADPECAP